MAPIPDPLFQSKFALNALEFVGMIGSTEVISAMGLLPLYQGKRWLGWYNAPGSFDLARHLSNLASSSSALRRAFARRKETPAVFFGFDGEKGPKYIAALSGTDMRTGHLGYLVMERCKEITEEAIVEGRTTLPTHIALMELDDVDDKYTVRQFPLIRSLSALIPITTSVGACTLCALVGDYYMASVIAIGIITMGLMSTAVGAGKLSLTSASKPAPGAPPGDGLLLPESWDSEDTMIVVKGSEDAVNAITKAKFELKLGRISQRFISLCAFLFLVECLVQLVLIPQGTLFGQIMFIASLVVSWTYSFYMSSFRKERLQADILFKKLKHPRIRKFRVGTRTTMTVLAAVLLFRGIHNPSSVDVKKVLHTFLPNDTLVWKIWRDKVTLQICDMYTSHLEVGEDVKDLTDDQKKLLNTLLSDSKAAFNGFSKHY